MGFGRGPIPGGRLPVFSTDTEEEAQMLIVMCCPRDEDGNYYARELADKQTLPNLRRFSDRLAAAWALLQQRRSEQRRV